VDPLHHERQLHEHVQPHARRREVAGALQGHGGALPGTQGGHPRARRRGLTQDTDTAHSTPSPTGPEGGSLQLAQGVAHGRGRDRSPSSPCAARRSRRATPSRRSRTEVATLKQELAAADAARGASGVTDDEREAHQEELEALREAHREAVARNTALSDRMVELNRELTSLTTKAAASPFSSVGPGPDALGELAGLRARAKELEETVAHLEVQLTEARTHEDALTRRVGELQEDLAEERERVGGAGPGARGQAHLGRGQGGRRGAHRAGAGCAAVSARAEQRARLPAADMRPPPAPPAQDARRTSSDHEAALQTAQREAEVLRAQQAALQAQLSEARLQAQNAQLQLQQAQQQLAPPPQPSQSPSRSRSASSSSKSWAPPSVVRARPPRHTPLRTPALHSDPTPAPAPPPLLRCSRSSAPPRSTGQPLWLQWARRPVHKLSPRRHRPVLLRQPWTTRRAMATRRRHRSSSARTPPLPPPPRPLPHRLGPPWPSLALRGPQPPRRTPTAPSGRRTSRRRSAWRRAGAFADAEQQHRGRARHQAEPACGPDCAAVAATEQGPGARAGAGGASPRGGAVGGGCRCPARGVPQMGGSTPAPPPRARAPAEKKLRRRGGPLTCCPCASARRCWGEGHPNTACAAHGPGRGAARAGEGGQRGAGRRGAR